MYGIFKIKNYEKPSHNSHNYQETPQAVNSENSENEITQVEKSLLPKVPPQHAPTDYKTAPLMVSVTGEPLHCIHCAAWTQGKGVWWGGSCLHTGDRKSNKSRCTLEVWEAVQ